MPVPLKSSILTIVILAGACCLAPPAKASAASLGYWHTNAFEFKLRDGLDMVLQQEIRIGDDVSKFRHLNGDIGLRYWPSEHFSISGNIRAITFRNQHDEWEEELRPYGGITWYWDNAHLALTVDNQLTRRLRSRTKDRTQFRSRIRLWYPANWTSWKFSPFIENTYIRDFDQDQYNENRISTGVTFVISPELTGEFFLLWQSDPPSDNWNDSRVIGTLLRWSL